MDKLIGLRLLSGSGSMLATDFLKSYRYTLLHFSASWNPYCLHFNPKLIDFYRQVNTPQHILEIATVGRDHTKTEHDKHRSSLPWLGFGFEESDVCLALVKQFDVVKYPALLLINRDGKVLHDCLEDVQSLGAKALPLLTKALT
jgi:thiol-disulfide isomerase/thioredoxin